MKIIRISFIKIRIMFIKILHKNNIAMWANLLISEVIFQFCSQIDQPCFRSKTDDMVRESRSLVAVTETEW